MNIKQIKNTLREFQAENRQKFKNTQAEFKKAVSYIKKKVYIVWQLPSKVSLNLCENIKRRVWKPKYIFSMF